MENTRDKIKVRAKFVKQWTILRRNRLLKRCLSRSNSASHIRLPSPTRTAAISDSIARRILENRQRWRIVRFLGDIIIKNNREATIHHAKEESNAASQPHRLVLWTDGSFFHTSRKAGAAVVYKARGSEDWQIKAFTLGEHGNNDAELFAIAAAMQLAWKEAKADVRVGENQTRLSEVAVYSDSQYCLRCVMGWNERSKPPNRFQGLMHRKIAKYARELSGMRVRLEMHWVPAHSSVKGNVAADAVAKQAARNCQAHPFFCVAPKQIDSFARPSAPKSL